MSKSNILSLLQQNDVQDIEFSSRMLKTVSEVGDDANEVILESIELFKEPAVLQHISFFLFHYGVSVSLSEQCVSELVQYVSFREPEFNECSVFILIAVCRQLLIYGLSIQNTLELTINNNIAFLELLQKVESFMAKTTNLAAFELLGYFGIEQSVPEQKLNESYYFLLLISAKKQKPEDLAVSNLLKQYAEETQNLPEYSQVSFIVAEILRELADSGEKGALQATKSLPERLRVIHGSKIALVVKLLLYNQLIMIKAFPQYCRVCSQVVKFDELKPANANEKALLLQIQCNCQYYYLRQEKAIMESPFMPLYDLHAVKVFLERVTQTLKTNEIEYQYLCEFIFEAVYYISLKIMLPQEDVRLQEDTIAEIADYIQQLQQNQLLTIDLVLLSVLIQLLNVIMYQNQRGVSQVTKQIQSQIAELCFEYVLFSPLLQDYLELHEMMPYLDYSQKLALLIVQKTDYGLLEQLVCFYRQKIEISINEPNTKLREYVLLKQKYNSLAEEYNKLIESAPGEVQEQVIKEKEEDIEKEIEISELEQENETEKLEIIELEAKLDNIEVQEVNSAEEKKRLMQELESQTEMSGVLEEELSIASERANQYEEEIINSKMQLAEEQKELENSKENGEKTQEKNKILQQVLQTVENVVSNVDIK